MSGSRTNMTSDHLGRLAFSADGQSVGVIDGSTSHQRMPAASGETPTDFPVEYCLGTKPSHAARSRALRNCSPLPTAASTAVAPNAPMPGIVISRRATSSRSAIASISIVTWRIRSNLVRPTTSPRKFGLSQIEAKQGQLQQIAECSGIGCLTGSRRPRQKLGTVSRPWERKRLLGCRGSIGGG